MRDHPFLGIDPGLRCAQLGGPGVTGWALVCGRTCLDDGNLRLPKRKYPDIVVAMEAEFTNLLKRVWNRVLLEQHPLPTVVVERYVYQGRARATNPAGYEVAELAGSLATRADCMGFQVLRIPRNEALRCFRLGKGAGVPSEAQANRALEAWLGIRLSNQHKRDAAMAAVAGQRRCR